MLTRSGTLKVLADLSICFALTATSAFAAVPTPASASQQSPSHPATEGKVADMDWRDYNSHVQGNAQPYGTRLHPELRQDRREIRVVHQRSAEADQ